MVMGIPGKLFQTFLYLCILNFSCPVGRWNFFFRLFIKSKIFDQLCKDGPGQPGQDSQDRTISVGF
jgi:hypothetical protein